MVFASIFLCASMTVHAQHRPSRAPEQENTEKRSLVAQPTRERSAPRPWLGVSLAPLTPAARSRYRYPHQHGGVLVTGVERNSPAMRAGIAVNDIIVRCNEKYVYTPEDVIKVISSLRPGDRVKIDTYRQGSWKPVTVALGRRDRPDSGAHLQPFDRDDDREPQEDRSFPKGKRLIQRLVNEIRTLRREVDELKRQVRELQKKTGIKPSRRFSGRENRDSDFVDPFNRDDDYDHEDDSPPTVPPPAF